MLWITALAIQKVLFAHPNIEVVFLPKNTASVMQPMDQGVVFKAWYSKKTFIMPWESVERNETSVREIRRKYNTAQCIAFIKESHDEFSARCVNSCWKKLWPDIVSIFEGFLTAVLQLHSIVRMAQYFAT